MDITWKKMIWQQFGAAIDMLENAINACPKEVWGDRSNRFQFWYIVYHTLFFLDLYLSNSNKDFNPPYPFTLEELDPSGILPDRVYTKEELLNYLLHCRTKCKAVIEKLTEVEGLKRCGIEWQDINVIELLLYNMRHVQHHAAQLNLILRQRIDSAPKWVKKTTIQLDLKS